MVVGTVGEREGSIIMSRRTKGRLRRCRSWTETYFEFNVEPDQLAVRINVLAREGWEVTYSAEVEDPEPHQPQTYTVEATREWCICDEDDPSS